MSWPSTLTVGAETWTRENCSDGYVYRVQNVTNPHVTIHGVRGSSATVDFYDWRRTGGLFHLRYISSGKVWEYQRGEPDPFMTQGGVKTTNKGAEEPQANSLAKSFWGACQAYND
jgi:hypothetical protein